jgi:hypothetical protein
MLSAVPSSGIVNRVIGITGIGDRDRPEWLIRISGIRIMLACLIGPAVRGHWAIENSLHWVLDMLFRDDECRVRTNHAPANFTTIKHMALNMLRKASGKSSMRSRRKAAGWDDDFLASLVKA